ncbi:MAG: 50S ribosomal protein L10 [Prosthecobacter sp.]
MKAEKSLVIEDLLKRVNASPFLFVVDYTGLKVDKFAELRKRLSASGAEIHVYKNNLVKKAAEKANYPGELGPHLTGQSAYVTGAKDVYATAKILKNFAAEFAKPVMKVGVLDGNLLDAATIKILADLPSREVLLSQLLGVLQAPASSLARVLKAKSELGAVTEAPEAMVAEPEATPATVESAPAEAEAAPAAVEAVSVPAEPEAAPAESESAPA